MPVDNETRSQSYVDEILSTVFGPSVAQPRRNCAIPEWMVGKETEASRTLVQFLQRWGTCRAASSSFNWLLMPADWELDGRHIVFAVENQGVCRWAIRFQSTVDAVYQQPDGATDWYRESDGLLRFLLTFCLWNAVQRGLKHRQDAEETSSLQGLDRCFDAVDSRLGRASRQTRLFYSDGAAVFCGKQGAKWAIHAAFRTRRAMAKAQRQFAQSIRG